jgi:ring-1,2-phenylacetyl-CoA epoxidase subunit PaaD
VVIALDELDAVRATLGAIPDPELPMLSIVDLGMVGDVRIEDAAIRVELYPTFVGCPALERIRAVVGEELAGFGRPVDVVTTFAVPWTSDRITPEGRAALRAAGIAPPAPLADLRCPLCDSSDVVQDNLFGPTACRSLHYCRTCRQPFEAMKPI